MNDRLWLDADSVEPPFVTNPVKLAATVMGHGPALLILHGLFGSGRNWGGIGRRLAQNRRVHLVDARNHGGSPWSDSMTYPEMADDLIEYIRFHGLAPVDVIGHSMGGKTAMTAALMRPEMVRRLIAVDIAPVAYRGGAQEPYTAYIEAMRRLDLAHLHRRAEAEKALASVIAEPSLRAFLVQNLEAEGSGYRWRINLDAMETNLPVLTSFPELESRYDGPVTVLAGELSNYVRPRDEATIQKFFPNARIVVVDGAGHWPHADQPERLIMLLNQALGD